MRKYNEGGYTISYYAFISCSLCKQLKFHITYTFGSDIPFKLNKDTEPEIGLRPLYHIKCGFR
jgi:hypothetical protein